jgi:glycosyltransferase involved in cell wall biosynthesis
MRVVAITQIWPNAVEPHRTPFNVQQFKRLREWCDVEVIDAIAHVPGVRLVGKVGGKKARAARVVQLGALPARDTIGGIETHYMRQLYVPKLPSAALPLYLGCLVPYREVLRRADVILGTWAYPDGCAAVLAARALGKPCVVKVHGTDINVNAKRPSVRRIVRRILPGADALVSVSTGLSAELEALGVPREKIRLVSNGVDKELFAPRDKREARRALGLREEGPVVLYVGRLETAKGMAELLEAAPSVRARLPDAVFAVIGEGEWGGRVAEAAAQSGGSIVAPGARPLKEVARWLAACDVLTLPSWAEGTPNVVLEAMASGRPVVATRIGGIPAAMKEPEAGTLVPVKDAGALADALVDVLTRVRAGGYVPDDVARWGPGSWRQSASELWDVLRSVAR